MDTRLLVCANSPFFPMMTASKHNCARLLFQSLWHHRAASDDCAIKSTVRQDYDVPYQAGE